MAGRQYQQVAYGLTSPLIAENPAPVIAKRNPTISDFAQPTTIWTNTTTNAIYILASVSNNQANWVLVEVGGGAGVFGALTVTPGPISLTGTTTINTAGAASTDIGTTPGTGIVRIGNTTGNTVVTGTLSATGTITSTTGQLVTTNAAISAGNTAASTQPATFQALKSRGGGVITSGDGLGQLLFAGYDGTQSTVGAAITSTSSGTIANTRVAGNLNFLTHADAPAVGPVSRMTINSAGNMVINPPDSGVALTITAGGETITAGDLVVTAGNITATAGSVTAGTTVTASLGNITATNGNVSLGTAGNKFNMTTGASTVQILAGDVDPSAGGGVAANKGSLFLRTNGTGINDRLWVNIDGTATGWTFVVTGA